MKKIYYALLCIVTLIMMGYQNANAQCSELQDCQVTTVCNNMIIDVGKGECPYKICFRQTLVCGEVACEGPVESCTTVEKGIGTNVCYLKMGPVNLGTDCNCTYMTEIVITRLHNGASGIYTTLILTGTNAQDFLDVLNGVPFSSANFFGYLDDCNGNPKRYAFSFVGGNLTAIEIE